MPLEEMIPIEGDDQVHNTGMVYPTSRHVVPVGDQYYPHHQGRKPEWQKDNYAEYVKVGDSWSSMSKRARRIKVGLETELTNQRRYHDWKGYDDIEPTGYTKVLFNDRQVGVVHGWAEDTLRHLLKVHEYIDKLQNLGVFGWFSDEDLQAVIGKQVDYDGYPGVVVTTLDGSGELTIYSPTWPDDGYDRGGRLRVPALYEKINWYPDPNRAPVKPTDPYIGPDYVESD